MLPIITAFLIISLLFTTFIEDFVYETKVEELTDYGNELMDIGLNTYFEDRNNVAFAHYRELLNARNIHFSLFNADGEILKPTNRMPSIFKLSESEWNELKNGESLIVKKDLTRFDQVGSLVVLPIINNGQFNGGVLLISPITGSEKMISEINRYLFYIVLIALILTVMFSWLLSSFHVKRIEKLRTATSAVSNGNYDVSLANVHEDEIGELTEDFNTMLARLKSSQEQIDRLDNRRRQFIADVSHELRTPLTTIKGIIEGFQNNMISADAKGKGILLISSETRRLLRLVNENLDYERIRSNQVTLNKVSIDVQDLMEQISDHLSFMADEKRNEFIVEVEQELTIMADYDRILQVLINVTKNSIQFTENGRIWLRGRNGFKETILEIEDTGIGVSPEEIETIWERFYKADISRRNLPYGEFGLGLSIVRKLVTLHSGTIRVESTKGKGTKFIIRIPN